MKEKNSDFIGTIAEVMDVPSSTLRYWEKEGLIRFERDGENNYRLWNLPLMWEIGDVAFYRELSVPVRKLKDLPNMDLAQVEEMLDRSEERLNDEMERIQCSLRRIQRRRAAIGKVYELREPRVVERAFPPIYDIVFEEYAGMRHWVHDPYEQVAYILASEPDFLNAGVMSNFQNRKELRPADPEPRLYLNCLLKMEYHNATNKDSRRTNLEELRAAARERGYEPGDMIGAYLISAFEGIRYTYYDCFLQLLPAGTPEKQAPRQTADGTYENDRHP